MKEVKFRAWDKEQKSMWIVDSTHFIEKTADTYRFEPNPLKDNRLERVSNFRFNYPERIILMQYTGLKDKHKKEIYEDDILQYPNKDFLVLIKFGKYNNEEDYEDNISGYGYYLEIRDKFTKEKRIEDLAYPNDTLKLLQIIGNIHENPELLETK